MVGAEVDPDLFEFVMERSVDCVERVGTVERHRGDPFIDLDFEKFVVAIVDCHDRRDLLCLLADIPRHAAAWLTRCAANAVWLLAKRGRTQSRWQRELFGSRAR